MRKTLLSDEPLQLDDILKLQDDGGPEEEKPYDPMPERQQQPPKPEPEEEPQEPAEEEPLEDDPDKPQNEPSPSPPLNPDGDPAQPAAQLATPRLGREYSAPVSLAPNPPVVTYRSRISIVEAWRYPGQLAQAPAFIDRSWIAWADADDTHPAGPALRVPVNNTFTGHPADGTKLTRIGDYVVRQKVSILDNFEEETVDVWPKEEFERLFIPVPVSTPTPARKPKKAA